MGFLLSEYANTCILILLTDVTEDGVVFDGMIFPDFEKGLWKQFKSVVFGSGDRSPDMKAGARAILPSWIGSIKGGMTIQSATDQFHKWFHRQLDVFTSFARAYTNFYSKWDDRMKDINEVSLI